MTTVNKIRIGLKGKLLWGEANATPATEASNARKVQLTLGKTSKEVTRRGSGGKKAYKGTLLDMAIEFELVDRDTDTLKAALLDSYLNGTLISLHAVDAAAGEGPLGDFECMEMNRDEDEENEIVYKVKLQPNDENRNWDWVAAGGEGGGEGGGGGGA